MQIFLFFRFKLVDYFHKQFACEKQKDRLLSYSQYYTNWPELFVLTLKKGESVFFFPSIKNSSNAFVLNRRTAALSADVLNFSLVALVTL